MLFVRLEARASEEIPASQRPFRLQLQHGTLLLAGCPPSACQQRGSLSAPKCRLRYESGGALIVRRNKVNLWFPVIR